jgi:antitoxin component of MazEF toxin-antitoxin module
MVFNFGHRTIQKTRYSYLLPLPVDWIKNMKIGKGDSLNIEMQNDHSLRITPIPEARQDSTEIRTETPNQSRKEVPE